MGLWALGMALAMAPGPRIGLALNAAEPLGEATFMAAVRQQVRLGVDGMAISAKWSDLEPTPGKYQLKPITDAVGLAKLYGAEAELTIQTIDTNQRTVPADLRGEPWDSPKMRDRFGALLTQIAPLLGDTVRWVSLGNEVDGYLDAHAAETDSFRRFVTEGRNALRARSPRTLVGVTVMFQGTAARPEWVRRMNEGLDVTFFTYYPLRPDFGVRPVGEVAGDLERMAATVPGRPVILQEAGYPASPRLDSSDEKQAEFVAEVLKGSHRFALVSFFLQHDFASAQLDVLTNYYGLKDDRFRAFLGTLGLRRSDGTARPAWKVLSDGLAPKR